MKNYADSTCLAAASETNDDDGGDDGNEQPRTTVCRAAAYSVAHNQINKVYIDVKLCDVEISCAIEI